LRQLRVFSINTELKATTANTYHQNLAMTTMWTSASLLLLLAVVAASVRFSSVLAYKWFQFRMNFFISAV
jgi:zona occludens toxin (predicted ATPase)